MAGKRRTPLPRSPTRKRTPRSKPVQRPNGETERLAVRRRDAMKYRLAGASYRSIAAKLTEDQANTYADANGISFERAMKKFPPRSPPDPPLTRGLTDGSGTTVIAGEQEGRIEPALEQRAEDRRIDLRPVEVRSRQYRLDVGRLQRERRAIVEQSAVEPGASDPFVAGQATTLAT